VVLELLEKVRYSFSGMAVDDIGGAAGKSQQ
jgi:hypothetical protein